MKSYGTKQALIVGNWKMNKGTADEAVAFVSALTKANLPVARTVAIAPPFTVLAAVSETLRRAHSSILLGAQNVHNEQHGAYTGEISAAMLVAAGCRLVIIGHSERRSLFGETDAFINLKIHAALSAGLLPILCVGETLIQRQEGRAIAVVQGQLQGALAGVRAEVIRDYITIAYEPVWAIGTGKTASPTIAQEMHASIRAWLTDNYGLEVANALGILYGGSVNPTNIAALMEQTDIDGALVGGASLELDDFLKIIDY